MGSEKTTTTTSQTVTPEVTPTQEELNRLQLEQAQQAQPGLLATQAAGLDLTTALLTGSELPGAFAGAEQGISDASIQKLADEALLDVATSAQFSGILNSGTAAELGTQASGDIRLGAEQFNINNLLNLLSLGLTGQGQVQQPILQSQSTLSSTLAGITPVTSTGTSTVTAPNPFLSSLQSSAGSSIGGLAGGVITGGFSTAFPASAALPATLIPDVGGTAFV